MSVKPYYKVKRKKRRKSKINLFPAIFTVIVVMVVFFVVYKPQDTNAEIDADGYNNLTPQTNSIQKLTGNIIEDTNEEEKEEQQEDIIVNLEDYPKFTDNTKYITSEFNCEHAMLVDTQTHEILVSKGGNETIYPASMTKVMTLLVAVEHIDNLDDKFLMTDDIINTLVEQQASRAGFVGGEYVTMRDLLYGLILPSGADAAVAIADYVAGSEEEFAKLMNEKAKELGLKNTHFVNTSGLHDENHYTTLSDISVILETAIKNNLCREILSTYQYRTEKTPQNPDGILLTSTMFSRMYGDEVEGVTIEGGKTGFTDQAGQCLASFARKDGKEYIAVLSKGVGTYSTIYDTFDIYEYLNK